MPRIDGQIKDLLTDVRDIEANVPDLAPGRLPEAVVFVETVVTCLSCGESYPYPSLHPLVRFKNKATAVRKWTSSINILPKEKETVHVQADKCRKCW